MAERARVLGCGEGSKCHVVEELRLGVLDKEAPFILCFFVVCDVALVSNRVGDIARPSDLECSAPLGVRYEAGALEDGLELRKGRRLCHCLWITLCASL